MAQVERSEALAQSRKRPRTSDTTIVEVTPHTSALLANHGPRTKRRKQGKLASLMGLPVDVLFEILGHLTPYDLLKLARVTKTFRQVLMSRSSITVWIQARTNVVGLPDCPKDMSEPAYANLAFSPHCHFCLCPNIRNIDWELRVRTCASCTKTVIEQVGLSHLWQKPSHTLIPTKTAYSARKPRVFFLKSQYDRVDEQLQRLNPTHTEAFVKERRQRVRDQAEHAALCEKWSREQALDRSQELTRLKKERQDAIVHKLQELGWGEEIEKIQFPDSLLDHPLVKQPHRLTHRIWANIKVSLIKHMESIRAKRLSRERQQLVHRRRRIVSMLFSGYKNAQLPGVEQIPEPVDYFDFEPIRTFIEQPSDKELSLEILIDLKARVPSLVLEWRNKVHQDFIREWAIDDDWGVWMNACGGWGELSPSGIW